ncbi:MAG TPA: glycosyltransferase family 39 protein [Tepidisphaeraceae bacterium]|jgi:hypothetical protein|nr:glycosyltransferase family 39 protein [Tepidisphaeraceae bacterium]
MLPLDLASIRSKRPPHTPFDDKAMGTRGDLLAPATTPPSMLQQKSIVALAACLIGTAMWWATPRAVAPVPALGWILAAVSILICTIPALNSPILSRLEAIRDSTMTHRAIASFFISLLAIAYLAFTAHHQNRDFFPKTLDDQSYVIQMHMLAQGKLWMPAHACADFFDTFHMLASPKYASAYFPGTAILYTPLIWLGVPIWIGPVIVAGASVGLVFRIVCELADAIAGAMAAVLLLSSSWFRTYSILVYGQPIALMLGLLMLWAWLRWREHQGWHWSLFIGVFGGLLAITRPADAVCYALPIASSSALLLRGKALRHQLVTATMIIAGAIPFLTVQAIQNIGITASITRTPFSLYVDRDQPGANFGFHDYDASMKPASVVMQKQVYYENFIVPFIQKHTLSEWPGWLKEHLPQIADVTLPAQVMLLLVPVGLLGLGRDLRRWTLVMPFLLFLPLYFAYPPFVEHYALPFVPAAILCVAMAPGVLRDRVPQLGNVTYLASVLVILIMSISMLPELNSKVNDETFPSPMMRVLHDQIDNSDLAPAVILFRYHPELSQAGDNSYKIEPVYNTGVAWPDDAPIILAHDLGSRNIEIIRYYAERQPQRTFYLFDRGNLADPLHRLGTAVELVNAGR